MWNGEVIAESNETINIEGNQYFPRNTIKEQYFESSDTHTICPWKGQASYFTLNVNGAQNKDAAWYYPDAKDAAKGFEGYVAFWKGVEVIED